MVRDSTGASASATESIAIVPHVSVTTPGGLPPAEATGTYNLALTTAGGLGPYSWAIVARPDGTWQPSGLYLTPEGVLTGRIDPWTANNYYVFTVQVTDSYGGTATQDLSISVFPWSQLTIATTSIPSAYEGQAYSYQLVASGGVGPYTWGFTRLATVPFSGGTTSLGRYIWNDLHLSSSGLIYGTAWGESLAPSPATIYVWVTDAGGFTTYGTVVFPYTR